MAYLNWIMLALGSTAPKGKNIRITTCLNHAMFFTEKLLF